MAQAQEEGQTPGGQVFFLTLTWAMVQQGATLEMKVAAFLRVTFSLHLEPVLSAWQGIQGDLSRLILAWIV